MVSLAARVSGESLVHAWWEALSQTRSKKGTNGRNKRKERPEIDLSDSTEGSLAASAEQVDVPYPERDV
jgi:hypothetical protein